MKNPPEEFRVKNHPAPHLNSDESFGNNGVFLVPHPKITGYFFLCQISDGDGWEHASVSVQTNLKKRKIKRCPTWGEMCHVKSVFWEDGETAIQFHPPKSQNISMHPYCLHLWRPEKGILPAPDPLMVGINPENCGTKNHQNP